MLMWKNAAQALFLASAAILLSACGNTEPAPIPISVPTPVSAIKPTPTLLASPNQTVMATSAPPPQEPIHEALVLRDCPDVYQNKPPDTYGPPSVGRLNKYLGSLKQPPKTDRRELACLQMYLHREAASVIGSAHVPEEFKIYLASFGEGRPVTHFATPYQVYVFLSPEAALDWRRAYYQLAHESLHVADGMGREPKGYSNYLEEGIAECFADMQTFNDLTMVFRSPNTGDQYNMAIELVFDLIMGDQPGRSCFNLLNHHRDEIVQLRTQYGSLGEVTSAGLHRMFPDVSKETINRLTTRFEH